MIQIETTSHDPYFNQAFEDYVFRTYREGDVLLLWRNRPAVVVGCYQNICREVHMRALLDRGIPVVRRMSGGGTVYHDLGNLNYTLISDQTGPLDYDRCLEPVIRALNALGVPAQKNRTCDIAVDGKKISGSAQKIAGGRVLHHGTLLFDSDPEMIAGALCADPEKFRSKSTKSVRSRVGNIRSFLPTDMTLEQFWGYLKSCLCENGFETGELDKQELNRIRSLKREKYDTWEWNYGKSPKYDMTNRRRWSGGGLEVRAQIEEGRICALVFYGDFLAMRPLEDITSALEGCLMRREDVAAVLDGFPLNEYFGGISRQELLDTIFSA